MTSAALHELRHALAAAVAAQMLGVRTAGLEILIEANADGIGEFAIIPADLSRSAYAAIMSLASLGVLVAHPRAEQAILTAQSLTHPMLESVYMQAEFSDEDFHWLGKWAGPITTPALVVAAVRELEADLGQAGRLKLCNVIRKLGSVQIDRPLLLDELCPPARAKLALVRAKQKALA
ncbi:hypothetical protein ACEUZ9_002686 [Paracoccus litorisediminis]|uniref:hypothetical protein n=1 Tax=Paracoccus litorisediminis TaxID=2006130 RepID=UPI0037332F31